MATQSTTGSGSNVKSADILASLVESPSLVANAIGVDPSKYQFAITASYILMPKDVDYASAYSILNGPNHFIVYINGIALKAALVKPSIVGYIADDGIFCAAFTQTPVSAVATQPTNTSDDAATAETISTASTASDSTASAAATAADSESTESADASDSESSEDKS